MKPHHRPRIVRHRDSTVRRIRSNVVPSYPSVDAPGINVAPQTADDDDRRLAPALDTGIAVQTRSDRAAANAAQRRRVMVFSAIGALVVLVSAAIVWRYWSDRLAAASPLLSAVAPSAARSAPASPGAASAAAAPAAASATPIFAHYKSVALHLPVPMMRLSEIGFHQASYAWAMPMKTSMKDANLSTVVKTKTTNRNRAAQPSGEDAVMTGSVIRMWRNRPGKPNTAADIGALAGTTVLSPVTGTVVRIKSYKLYGRYSDYEMHIIPDGFSHLDVVMIHLTSLSCSPGDRVVAGVTPVAKIRKFSDKFHDQLSDYTKDAGDHVHLQINDSTYRGYKGLQGAVDPSAEDSSTVAD